MHTEDVVIERRVDRIIAAVRRAEAALEAGTGMPPALDPLDERAYHLASERLLAQGLSASTLSALLRSFLIPKAAEPVVELAEAIPVATPVAAPAPAPVSVAAAIPAAAPAQAPAQATADGEAKRRRRRRRRGPGGGASGGSQAPRPA